MPDIPAYLMRLWAALLGRSFLPKPEITMPVPLKSAAALSALMAIVAPIVAENESLAGQVASLKDQLAADAKTAADAAALDDTDTAAALSAFASTLPQPVAAPAATGTGPVDPAAAPAAVAGFDPAAAAA